MVHSTGNRICENSVRNPNDIRRMPGASNNRECFTEVVSQSVVIPALPEKHVDSIHL